MTDAFDPGTADPLGITPKPLHVSQAVHKANVTVDENGTQASAATAIESVLSRGHVSIVIDRPFAFAIVDRATDVPLFLGVVTDPRSK